MDAGIDLDPSHPSASTRGEHGRIYRADRARNADQPGPIDISCWNHLNGGSYEAAEVFSVLSLQATRRKAERRRIT